MADESQPIDQEEIEQLLRQSRGEEAAEQSGDAGAEGAAEQPDATAQGQPADPAAATAPESGAAAALEQPTGGQSPAPDPSAAGLSEQPGAIAPADVEMLLNQAQSALDSINAPADPSQPADVASFRLAEFSGAPASTERATLDLLGDVELDVRIELGRTQMFLEDVLKLRSGSVVGLDKLAGDHVDIYVNGRLVARGEILVMNDNFCVRVAELIATEPTQAAG